jgi:hypothetical protein
VEDEHGVVINGLHASDMRKYARKIWTQLREVGKAPPTWGKADSDAISSYRRSMRRRFPELALCELDWKSDKLATANYSNWSSTPVLEKTSDILSNMTRRCSDSATRVSKKARVETAPPLSNTTDFPAIPVSQHTSAAGDSNVFPDPTSVFPLSGSTSTFTTQANHEARLQFNGSLAFPSDPMVTPNAATDTGDFLGGNTLLHQANAEFAEFNSHNMATFPIHPALMQGWIQSNPQETMSQNPDI